MFMLMFCLFTEPKVIKASLSNSKVDVKVSPVTGLLVLCYPLNLQ